MKGIDRTMLIIIFAIIMLILVVTFSLVKIWPLIRWGPFSPCWGRFISDMGSFTGIEFMRKPQTIVVGDCVSAIMFVNKEVPLGYFNDVDPEYIHKLDCDIGGQSYVIGFPHTKYEDAGWNVFKWPKKVWEEMKEFWREDLGGVGPVCKMLDREKRFTLDSTQAIVTPGTYCIEVKLTDDKKSYEVTIDDGACEKADRKKNVGVPIP